MVETPEQSGVADNEGSHDKNPKYGRHGMSQQTDWAIQMEQKREQEHVRDIVGKLADLVNGNDTRKVAEMFYQGFINQHRTLQEMMWKMILEVIMKYADCEWFDARNEFAVRSCKAMREYMLDNPGKFYLPVI